MADDVETTSFRSGELDLYARLRHCADQVPAVVLLSGLGFHTFEYEPFAIQLAAAGFNTLSFDYRGHGRSPGPRGRWTLGELTADCQHAIGFARQRHRGPIVLFGNSLGAMVAILAGARDARPSTVIAANCPAHTGDFLLTRPRRALFAVMKLTGPVAPLRLSVDHFIAYRQLIDDPSWVATMQRDPLIADARRLSAGTLRELLETGTARKQPASSASRCWSFRDKTITFSHCNSRSWSSPRPTTPSSTSSSTPATSCIWKHRRCSPSCWPSTIKQSS